MGRARVKKGGTLLEENPRELLFENYEWELSSENYYKWELSSENYELVYNITLKMWEL